MHACMFSSGANKPTPWSGNQTAGSIDGMDCAHQINTLVGKITVIFPVD